MIRSRSGINDRWPAGRVATIPDTMHYRPSDRFWLFRFNCAEPVTTVRLLLRSWEARDYMMLGRGLSMGTTMELSPIFRVRQEFARVSGTAGDQR